MADLGKDLYDQIRKVFEAKYKKATAFGQPLDELRKKIDAGEALIIDADLYAMQVGGLISESLQEVLVADVLPDRRLYYELAEQTLGQTLKDTHYMISNVAAEIEEEMNQAIGVGLKPVKVKPDTHRINGLLKIADEAEDFDTVKHILVEPVVNFAQNVVDTSVKENAKFQEDAGLKVMVLREYDGVGIHDGERCEWCWERQGKYTYENALAAGVFQRHPGCNCLITYTSKKGITTRSTSAFGWS